MARAALRRAILEQAERQAGFGSPGYRPLVAFDFDGTLTWKDSLRDFLAWREGPLGYLRKMARVAPEALRYTIHKDRTRLKAVLVREFLAGEAREKLEAEARDYASARAPKLLRPDALRFWRFWQQDQNARLLIVTATPETIVAPFAADLGAHMLIGSRLAFDQSGAVTGMDGPNCRGPEKVRRLQAIFGDDVKLDVAFGDSDGDLDMLGLANERGLRIFGERP